jgi:isocitrate/isopropylmalate dehydrogenase
MSTPNKDPFISLAFSAVAQHAAQRKRVRKMILAAFKKAPRRSLVLKAQLLAAFREQERFYREQCRELKAMLRTHGNTMAANMMFCHQALDAALEPLGGLGSLIAGLHGLYGMPARGRKLTEKTWEERLDLEHANEREIHRVMDDARSRAVHRKIKQIAAEHKAQLVAQKAAA